MFTRVPADEVRVRDSLDAAVEVTSLWQTIAALKQKVDRRDAAISHLETRLASCAGQDIAVRRGKEENRRLERLAEGRSQQLQKSVQRNRDLAHASATRDVALEQAAEERQRVVSNLSNRVSELENNLSNAEQSGSDQILDLKKAIVGQQRRLQWTEDELERSRQQIERETTEAERKEEECNEMQLCLTELKVKSREEEVKLRRQARRMSEEAETNALQLEQWRQSAKKMQAEVEEGETGMARCRVVIREARREREEVAAMVRVASRKTHRRSMSSSENVGASGTTEFDSDFASDSPVRSHEAVVAEVALLLQGMEERYRKAQERVYAAEEAARSTAERL